MQKTLTIAWAIFLSVIFFLDGAEIEEELETFEKEVIIDGKNVSRRKKHYKNKSSYGLFQTTTKSREFSSTKINDKIGFAYKKFSPRRRRRTTFPMKPKRHHIIITS
jgi:diacylglycerol kinase family enzyme